MQVCQLHSGMCSRDKMELELDGAEARLHAKIAANRAALDIERRRIDTIVGSNNDNGKLSALRKDVESLLATRADLQSKINTIAWKIFAAAVLGTGGTLTALKLL